jgi:hypothetical protein
VKSSSKNSGGESFSPESIADCPRRKAKKRKVSSSNLGVAESFAEKVTPEGFSRWKNGASTCGHTLHYMCCLQNPLQDQGRVQQPTVEQSTRAGALQGLRQDRQI